MKNNALVGLVQAYINENGVEDTNDIDYKAELITDEMCAIYDISDNLRDKLVNAIYQVLRG